MGFNPISAVKNAVSTVTDAVTDTVGNVAEGVQDTVEAANSFFQDVFDGGGDSAPMGPIAGIQGCCNVDSFDDGSGTVA